MLEVVIDVCGRVLEARVKDGAGRKDLDVAAMEAIKQWVLAEPQRAKAIDGRLEQSVSFSMNNNMKMRPVDWPETHRRARYVLDGPIEEYATAEEASKSIRESDPNVVRPPVMNVMHRFTQFDAPEGREFWLFLTGKNRSPTVAARYRPVIEGAEPVVRVAMACDLTPAQCESMEKMLLKGLSFPKRRN